MNLFRKKEIVKFNEKEVEIYEVSIETLLKLRNKEYQTNNDILLDHTNLNEKEIKNLSINAITKLFEVFNKVNKEHLGGDDEGK